MRVDLRTIYQHALSFTTCRRCCIPSACILDTQPAPYAADALAVDYQTASSPWHRLKVWSMSKASPGRS